MVTRGVDRLVGHRVDGVRADQVVDVERVRVVRVLGRGRGPERALNVRALGGERLPARSAEEPLERVVGDLRIGDRRLAAQVLASGALERGVDLGVDARDEEARHRRGRLERLAPLGATLEPADVGLGDRLIARHGEQQRDVDVQADRGQLLERAHARVGARHLDQHVRAIDRGAMMLGRLDRLVRIVRQRCRDLERHVSVSPVCAVPRGPQQVGRVADVLVGQLVEDLLDVAGLTELFTERVVVAVGVAHRLLEDRRVGGHAADPVLLDQPAQGPPVEELPADVVQPDRLAEGLDVAQWVTHLLAPFVGYVSEVSYPAEPPVIFGRSARHAMISVLRSRPSRRR